MKLCLTLMLALALATGDTESAPKSGSRASWAGYTGQANWTDFLDYPMVVFDANDHPPVRPLNGRGKEVFARLLFVAEPSSKPYEYELQLLESPAAIHQLMEDDVPELVREGFDGLLLDMDTQGGNLALSENVRLVINRLQTQYPYLKLMLSTSVDSLFDMRHPGNYLLVRVRGGEALEKDENTKITIRNIKNYIKLFPYKTILLSVESEKPSGADCKAFAKLNVACYANTDSWNRRPGDIK